MAEGLLSVEGLRIDLRVGANRFSVVKDVSFTIAHGETFGLVGESGCGKSVVALSLIGLLRPPLGVGAGRILFEGGEIQNLSRTAMRKLRGKRISMIFQEPMTALNPLSPIGRQIAEMFVLHEGTTWHEAERRAVEALARVHVPAPDRRARDYPHRLSGGMRQRVMIAIALACSPSLLLADEPTTALDVTVQAEILDLIRELAKEQGTSVLMISHDLGLIAQACQRVGVMYAGRLVEQRRSDEIFRSPRHPYTKGLIAALPVLGTRTHSGRTALKEIAGLVPTVTDYASGCRFHPRCYARTEVCTSVDPTETVLPSGGFVACHHHE